MIKVLEPIKVEQVILYPKQNNDEIPINCDTILVERYQGSLYTVKLFADDKLISDMTLASDLGKMSGFKFTDNSLKFNNVEIVLIKEG